VRALTDRVADVQGVLAATANPEHADEVTVSQPSAALEARAAAQSALDGLFLGLGAVALLLAALGGVAGVAIGSAAAVVIGALAGLLPSMRAARMPPTEALRSL
jgi:putative ABC transport system permease protein